MLTGLKILDFRIKQDGSKGKEILWPEELDNELRALYEEYLLFEEKPEGKKRKVFFFSVS